MSQDPPSPAYQRSIEDNYERYFEESAGYAYDAFDRLSPSLLLEHDRCREATREQLGSLSLEPTSEIGRWAMARAWLDCGQAEQFFTLTRGLLNDRAKDERGHLNYLEILELASLVAIRQEEPHVARELLDQWRASATTPEANAQPEPSAQAAQEHESLERLEARLALAANNEAEAQRRYEALIQARPDDAELAIELAADAASAGQIVLVLSWLDRAEQIAKRTGARAALVDIALMRETHQQRQATDGSLGVRSEEE